MPMFEFYCEKCSTTEEKYLPIKEADQTQTCQKCNNIMKKLVSKFSFILKGPGFHVNDYPS